MFNDLYTDESQSSPSYAQSFFPPPLFSHLSAPFFYISPQYRTISAVRRAIREAAYPGKSDLSLCSLQGSPKETRMKESAARVQKQCLRVFNARRAILYFLLVLENFVARDETLDDDAAIAH